MDPAGRRASLGKLTGDLTSNLTGDIISSNALNYKPETLAKSGGTFPGKIGFCRLLGEFVLKEGNLLQCFLFPEPKSNVLPKTVD
jgi:hypothetical protein